MSCCVAKCKNRHLAGYALYRFPQDPDRRKEWETRVNRSNWHANDHSRLCSVSFKQAQLNKQQI